MDDVDFLASTDLGLVDTLWSSQRSRLRTLITDATPVDTRWRALIPDAIRPAEGKRHIAAFLSLMMQCGPVGRRWCRQFIYGFELVGVLSQEGVPPVDPRTARHRPAPTEKLFASSLSRFRERSAKYGRANGKLLCEEALAQQEKGWASPHFRIDPSNKGASKRDSPIELRIPFWSVALVQASRVR